MTIVEHTVHVPAAPDDVWTVLRDFGSIADYVPAITDAEVEGEGVGATRTLTLADGAVVVEHFDALNDAAHSLSYSIVDAPLPIDNYVATIQVRPDGDAGCSVTWHSSFDVTDGPTQAMTDVFEDLYASGLEGLKQMHE